MPNLIYPGGAGMPAGMCISLSAKWVTCCLLQVQPQNPLAPPNPMNTPLVIFNHLENLAAAGWNAGGLAYFRQAATQQQTYIPGNVNQIMDNHVKSWEAKFRENIKLISSDLCEIIIGHGVPIVAPATLSTDLTYNVGAGNARAFLVFTNTAAGGHTVGVFHDGGSYFVYDCNQGLFVIPPADLAAFAANLWGFYGITAAKLAPMQ